MPNQNIQEFKCTIRKMFNGCPKANGWFGCFAHIRGQINDVKLIGTTNQNLVKGMQLNIKAYKKDDDNYETYEVVELDVITKTKTGLFSYLSSLHGINKMIAAKIVNEFGEKALEEIENNPKHVQKTLNLTDVEITNLYNGVQNANRENTLKKFLPELSENLIKRVLEQYKDTDINKIIKEIKDNPYKLTDITGISFQMADTIALKLGIQPLEPFRVNHGLVHILKTDTSGNLFINLTNTEELQKLYVKVEEMLHVKFTGLQEFGYRLIALNNEKFSPIKIDKYNGEQHLYLTDIYNDLKNVISTVNQLNHQTSLFKEMKLSAKNEINMYQADTGFCALKEQKDAIKNALEHKISIVTGGPGRGKTTVIDCIASCWTNGFKSIHKTSDILLLAPTGKAMNKLKKDTHGKYETMTIDRLISSVKNTSDKKLNKYLRMNTKSTFIIIDESSMIDIAKMSELFNIMYACQFCFVGDIDQLPPISPGHVLKSLIDSKKIPTTYLIQSMRATGIILSNADKINQNDIVLQYDVNEMPFFPQDEDDETALEAILEQYNEERDECPDITQIALLSPVRKGPLGTVSINIAIQEAVCPLNVNGVSQFDANKNEYVITTKGYPINITIYGNGQIYTRFRIGDIVLNTKNNNEIVTHIYEKNDYWNGKEKDQINGIYNGDCGRIIGYIPADKTNDTNDIIIVQLFDNRIIRLDVTLGEFDSFELGYAMTVHKSQGCEYETVIYVSPKSLCNMALSGFATKNLVYTAVTRAKKRVVIIGSKDALNTCILNNLPNKNSNLAERIK